MKKLWIIIAVIVVVGGGAAIYFATKGDNKKSTNLSGSTVSTPAGNVTVTYSPVNDACKVLTLADAQAVIGPTAKAGTATPQTSSADIEVSTCTYLTPIVGTDIHSIVNASILVRSAKTKTGANSNKAVFAALPAGDQAVSGYGDSAYWSSALGQLNILKHNNWYILSEGGTLPTEKTLDGTKKLADQIKNRL